MDSYNPDKLVAESVKGQVINFAPRTLIITALALLAVACVGIYLLHGALAVKPATARWLLPIFVALAACGCEFIDSSLGMGYGTTLTPVLLLAGFAPLQVVPAILVSELTTGVVAALLHQREGNMDIVHDRLARQTALILAALSVVGATLAVFVALKIPAWLLGTVIGILVTMMGIFIMFTLRQTFPFKVGHIVALGTLAAFNKGLSGGGYGPLVTGGQVVCGVSPKQAVGITSLAEAATCLVALVVYLFSGQLLAWDLVIPLLVGGLLSVPFSVLTIKRIAAIRVRAAIGIGTILLGLLALAKIWL